jgi:hypothetical protein
MEGGEHLNENPGSGQQNYDDNPYLSIGKSPGHLSQALTALQGVTAAPEAKQQKKGFGAGLLSNKLFSRESAQVPNIQ